MPVNKRWNRVGKVCLGLAVGALCLSPVLARQVSPRLLPKEIQLATTTAPGNKSKEVILTKDGSFRVAVELPDGRFVTQAEISFANQQGAEQPLRMQVTSEQQLVVMGLSPGSYQVHIEAARGTFDGTLDVRQPPEDDVPIQQVVSFTLLPNAAANVIGQEPAAPEELAPPPAPTPEPETTLIVEEVGTRSDRPRRRFLLPVLGLTTAALSGTALGLAIGNNSGGGGGGGNVASP